MPTCLLLTVNQLFNGLVENYSEVDWFDFEMRMRKLIYQLIEPTVRQATDDRNQMQKLFKHFDDHERRVNNVEIVLFKKDENQRMQLFDEIFDKLNEDRKLRLIEEEKIRDQIASMKDEIKDIEERQDIMNKTEKNQEE